MKKICVVSSGRWDYGLLYWVMKGIEASDKLELFVICPMNHHEFESIAKTFNTYPAESVKSINDYGKFYSDCLICYKKIQPDIVLVLGDRFEINAAATAALLLNIPIAHCHGGESTLGAFDNELRNSISQMATYHFTAHEEYAKKVMQMTGIKGYYNVFDSLHRQYADCPSDEKIFNFGAPGLDWIRRAKLKTKAELQQDISIDLDKSFVLACFNPVTKELQHTKEYINNLLTAIDSVDMQFIFIKPNVDPTNDVISEAIDEYWGKYNGVNCDGKTLVMMTRNLDHLTYLSLMQYCSFIIGNSSSGIIEAASFNLPAVNVGTRQQGRIKPLNVFDCNYDTESILKAIKLASSYREKFNKTDNPYGSGNASKRIVEILGDI